jgi:hypothetical protein
MQAAESHTSSCWPANATMLPYFMLLQVEGYAGAHAALTQFYLELLLVLQLLFYCYSHQPPLLYWQCRLKATLERMQRFTESYLELLLKLLPPVAESLGKALGVAPYAIQTFTEAEIRANVVFQVRVLFLIPAGACAREQRNLFSYALHHAHGMCCEHLHSYTLQCWNC